MNHYILEIRGKLPFRSRSSSKKNRRGGGNVLQPKDQAFLPGTEEERLQEERDLHVYRKLQVFTINSFDDNFCLMEEA